ADGQPYPGDDHRFLPRICELAAHVPADRIIDTAYTGNTHRSDIADHIAQSDIHADSHGIRHRPGPFRHGAHHELCPGEHHTAGRTVTDSRMQHHRQEDGDRGNTAVYTPCPGHRGHHGADHHILPGLFHIPARTAQIRGVRNDI